jgi:hypothetical protein
MARLRNKALVCYYSAVIFFLERGEERRSTHKYRCTVLNCDIIQAFNSLDYIN